MEFKKFKKRRKQKVGARSSASVVKSSVGCGLVCAFFSYIFRSRSAVRAVALVVV
jgi:hypothetical protein